MTDRALVPTERAELARLRGESCEQGACPTLCRLRHNGRGGHRVLGDPKHTLGHGADGSDHRRDMCGWSRWVKAQRRGKADS